MGRGSGHEYGVEEAILRLGDPRRAGELLLIGMGYHGAGKFLRKS